MLSSVVVQKFGGSSLGTTDKVSAVADGIAHSRESNPLVVVASAMGGRTDALVQLAQDVSAAPPAREIDALLSTGECASTALLAMALQARGIPAISMRGWQAGIHTRGPHGHARIDQVDPAPLREALDRGQVPVVAGFQGLGDAGAITTLGRGGSDTTAVALAATLGARCEIYSDVPGVFTADPREVPGARPLTHLSYDEMIEFARQGASVLNEDAVAVGRKDEVAIYAGSTFERSTGGTTISARACSTPIAGVAGRDHVVRVIGRARDVEAMSAVHHRVAHRSHPRGLEALVVLNEGTRSELLAEEYGIEMEGDDSTVSIVGSNARALAAMMHEVLGRYSTLGREAGVFLGDHSVTGVVEFQNRQSILRALHAGLLETEVRTGA